MRDRILVAARQELAEVGPAALSMRAVARRIGVTVGALYRYFENRDALLTELIVEGYSALGTAVAAGAGHGDDERAGNENGAERWISGGLAARNWAVAHPHEFSLLYGTPVIGYEAPERTIENATLLIEALVGILAAQGVTQLPAEGIGDTELRALEPDVQRVREWLRERGIFPDAEQVSGQLILAVIRYWTELIGTISFELTGHYRGSVENGAAYLERLLRIQAASLGLT